MLFVRIQPSDAYDALNSCRRHLSRLQQIYMQESALASTRRFSIGLPGTDDSNFRVSADCAVPFVPCQA